ncbi:hypothetical protein AAZV13_06G187100 [Glycine max]
MFLLFSFQYCFPFLQVRSLNRVISKKIFSEKLCERPVYYLLSPRFTRIMLCLDSILARSPIARQHSAHHQTVLLGPSCIMVCEKCAQWRATCKRIFLLMFGESNDKCAYLI